MSLLAGSRRVTSDDLDRMTDPHRFELIDGELVERAMSYHSSEVAAEINSAVRMFVRANNLGHTAQADGGLQCFQSVLPEDPDRVPFPDGSFVSHRRAPDGIPSTGWLKVAPELVLEVVSPNDVAEDLDRKAGWYFRAGVRSVWIAFPETMTIWVRHPDRNDRTFGPGDTVEDPEVLPGFAVPIEDLFPA